MRLVAQGSKWRLGIEYKQTYSLTFWYLIVLTVKMNLQMQLMDVVTAYLYETLDIEIYMNVPEGIKVPKEEEHNLYSVKLQKSLCCLKQFGRMWYNRLSNFLPKKGFFIKKLLRDNYIISSFQAVHVS